MKKLIKNNKGLNVLIKHRGTNQKSTIFCDEIEYICDGNRNFFDHHLMFWNKRDLVFKVWLPNENKDNKFKNIYDALKAVNIMVIK